MVVKSELQKLRLHFLSVDLREAKVLEEISEDQLKSLAQGLKKLGLNY